MVAELKRQGAVRELRSNVLHVGRDALEQVAAGDCSQRHPAHLIAQLADVVVQPGEVRVEAQGGFERP